MGYCKAAVLWKLRGVIVLTLILMPFLSHADDGNWQQWTEISWSQNLGYGWDTSLRLESRWEDDLSQFAYYEIEPSLIFRHSPRWDFSLGYEYDQRLEPIEEADHVPNLVAVLKIPLKEWKISNQFRMEFAVPEDDAGDWRAIYRNRTKIETSWKWGSKRLVPYLFDEWFFNTDEIEITQNRVGLGIGIPIVSHWMGRIYWMRLDEKIASGWEWHPVLGIQIQAQF